METPQAVAFGTLLRRHRVAAGLTQEELAERAGISRRSIGDMERGVVHTPRKDTVALLAAALSLTPPDRVAFAEAARRLGAAPPIAALAGTSAPPFVGRAQELALLERHLAGEGPPLLLLAGEPGIGKTRLLQAAIPRAVAQGLRVLEGGCQRRGGQEPYAPLLGALQRHLRGQRPQHVRAELEGCAWLVRLLPELAGGPIPPVPPWTMAPAHEQRLMREAVGRFLANVAGPAGTLLVLDDLQWAGRDALDLIATLARSAEEVPLRLLGAYRDTEVQPQESLSVVLADLAHAGLAARRQLGPLAPEEAVQLLDSLLERGADESAPRERVLQRAGGVPFYVVSCARGAAWAGRAEGQGAESVPWDIAQSVRQRLAALPEEARDLLGVAAVAGRVVRPTVLTSAAGQAEGSALAALDAACQARLLVSTDTEAYQFAHDVIREVVEAGLGPARRLVLHRRVAEALEQHHSPPPIELLAYHFGRSDAPEKAIPYLERAGDQAQAQYAHAAAEVYYRELLERVDGLGRVADAARAGEKWGTTLYLMARYDAALAALERAAATYRAGGDREGEERALARIGYVHAGRETPHEGLARLQPLLPTQEDSAPSPGLAALQAALAWLLMACNRLRECVEACDRAAELARAVGDVRVLADVQVRRAGALSGLGYLEEGLQAAESAIPLVEAVGDLDALGRIYNNLGNTYKLRGEFERSRRCRERALELTEQIGDVIGKRWAMAGLGELLFLRGDWAAARAQFEHAVHLSHSVGWSLLGGVPLVGLAELYLATGAWEEAARCLDGLQGNPKVGSDVQRLLAQRHLLDGQPAAACACLTPLVDEASQGRATGAQILPLLAQAHLERGAVIEAGDAVAPALTYARAEHDRLTLVDALRVQAMVAIRQERWGEAECSLAEGLALARGMPYPYAEARLQHVYGQLRVQRSEPGPARERLEAALAIFRGLGACGDLERVEQELAAL
jgi:tetratricopeptide (TPR) repeat protein/transcriptional regulator with XRE-family HTH domain